MQYKQAKPDMGLFIIRCRINNKCYLQGTQDLRGVMNGARMRLANNMHPNKELQKDWSEFGPDNFTVEILEHLAYDKDETKTDYTEDLALLQMIWEERLAKENAEFYKKKI